MKLSERMLLDGMYEGIVEKWANEVKKLEAIKFAAEMLFQPNIIGEAARIAERELRKAIREYEEGRDEMQCIREH